MATSNLISFRDYLLLEKKYSLHTQKAYSKDIEEFIDFLSAECFGVELEKVSYSHIRQWVVSLVELELTNRSVNRKIASLKAFYRFLLKTKQIEKDPLLKHRALKEVRNIQIPFSESEMTKSLKGKFEEEDFDGLRNQLMVELFYATGLRKTELIELKLQNIDLKERVVRVLGKGNKERVVPLLPNVIEGIERYLVERNKLSNVKNETCFFLSSKGLKLSQSFVYRIINLYFSGVSEKVKKSPHVLRHTFATHMLDNGADLNSIKELLGHSSLSSTQVYTNSSLSGLKNIYKKAHPRNRK